MIKRYHQLIALGLVIEIAGAVALFKIVGWEAVLAMEALILGRQITSAQNSKRKRDQLPPNEYIF